ncbi:hypothetical protein EDEG_01994 [Edhazardia aedis USNM 41457]|uniref:acetate--CoA ligase n=1 Tax=Edhazardia aedis (strain USNM 41457) TaxID=1003232 RepID=J9D882_EDHAE|nr:hypothetical protein EDEG_01994 [Edhazardia aedis USNM 41457]|eukprot:EJW03714.1 hypothetical protein EDEG_01994 [Edhazardia aedis USNM 41457]
MMTTKKVFNLKKDDVFLCTADLGWITGHTYAVYGPLLNGVTTVLFGGVPMFPTKYRLFETVERFKVTHLYTAPTLIRMLQKSIGNKSDIKVESVFKKNNQKNQVINNDTSQDKSVHQEKKLKIILVLKIVIIKKNLLALVSIILITEILTVIVVHMLTNPLYILLMRRKKYILATNH